jgi:hypothetical protein
VNNICADKSTEIAAPQPTPQWWTSHYYYNYIA